MKVRNDIPHPDIELVQSKIDQFDKQNKSVESGLVQLVRCFPENEDLGHVLVKVSAINSLYSTQIRGVMEVANVIVAARIDSKLDAGDEDAVGSITKVEYSDKPRWNYSFATKYCSWHRPELFPILDSRVDFCLRSYKAKDSFADFTQENLWDYRKFREIVKKFQTHYRLEFTFKNLDKFFYQLGNEYLGQSSETIVSSVMPG